MPIFFPTLIPRSDRDGRLLNAYLVATDEAMQKDRKEWENVRRRERTAIELQRAICNSVRLQLQTCRSLSGDWIREHEPYVTEAEVERTVGQLRRIGKQHCKCAVQRFDDDKYLVHLHDDDERTAKRNITNQADATTEFWIDDFLDYVSQQRSAHILPAAAQSNGAGATAEKSSAVSRAAENEKATLDALRLAIQELPDGKNKKPDIIIKAAKLNNATARLVLRKMQDAGEYHGFVREKPRRYRSEGASVPER